MSFKFAVLGGSSAESKASKGAAHFLSTAAFAGNNSSSGMKIVNDLESLGATFQSYSDKEKVLLIHYHASFVNHYLNEMFLCLFCTIDRVRCEGSRG